MTDWQDKAATLAKQLEEAGDLRSEAWRKAVSEVPRHELVPSYYTQNEDFTWSKTDSGSDEWLDAIYSDTTLITALADFHPKWGTGQIAVSSSTKPGLMLSMLEVLDVHDGDKVLEIGTGTGYNAALLCYRLGSGNVFTVDVDDALTSLARQRLTGLGYTPTVVTRDGVDGLAEYAPYDRIIATCCVPAIPQAWINQTKQQGSILTDLKVGGIAGNLVLLERVGDTATGRFLPSWAGFMNMRHAEEVEKPRQPRRDRSAARERRTTAPFDPWTHHVVPWFLAQFAMPENLSYGYNVETGDSFLTSTDGSWCEVSAVEVEGERRVVEAGPSHLWTKFEDAYDAWHALGQPGWSRFGLTVTPDAHTVWLDEPDGEYKWTLHQR